MGIPSCGNPVLWESHPVGILSSDLNFPPVKIPAWSHWTASAQLAAEEKRINFVLNPHHGCHPIIL